MIRLATSDGEVFLAPPTLLDSRGEPVGALAIGECALVRCDPNDEEKELLVKRQPDETSATAH
jgi:hypothetical protein